MSGMSGYSIIYWHYLDNIFLYYNIDRNVGFHNIRLLYNKCKQYKKHDSVTKKKKEKNIFIYLYMFLF
jgi:hypothetical protein